MKNSIKAVIWDLDGTLIDFKIDFIRARKEANNILKNNGIRDEILSLERGIVDTVKIAKKEFISIGKTENQIQSIIYEINEKVIDIEREAAYDATMINGIDKVLEFINQKKLKQAIYTYNHSENAILSLKKVNLLNYFEVIAGRDSIDNPKPHPDHLNHICSKLNVNSNQVVVIGDHYRDIQGAQNVGAHSIAIHSKLADAEKLKIADVIIEEKNIPSQLIRAINDLI